MVRQPSTITGREKEDWRVRERLAQAQGVDIKRIKYPSPKIMMVPGLDIRGVATLTAWPAANKMLGTPFEIRDSIVTVVAIRVATGSAGGNLDVGIMSDTGIRLGSSGAQVLASVTPYRIPLTAALQLQEGRYFLVAVSDGVAIRVFQDSGYGSFMMMGCVETASSYPIPATATLVDPANPTGVFVGGIEFL